MILVLTLFFQVFGTHVYAAPNTVSGNSVKETETSGETITDSTYIEPVTGIEIPDSITSIGYGAFDSCYNLTGVYISDLAAWCNIYFSYNIKNTRRLSDERSGKL